MNPVSAREEAEQIVYKVTTKRSGMSYDEATDAILALAVKIAREVVGEDDHYVPSIRPFSETNDPRPMQREIRFRHRNHLRAEQLTRLKAYEGE